MQWCFGFSQPAITQHLKRSEARLNFERVDTWWGDLPEVKHVNDLSYLGMRCNTALARCAKHKRATERSPSQAARLTSLE